MKRLAAVLLVLVAMATLLLAGCSSDQQTRHDTQPSPRIYSTPDQESAQPGHTTDDGWGDLYYTD
jgi:outer membrane biogenesis lipoprotein LolB